MPHPLGTLPGIEHLTEHPTEHLTEHLTESERTMAIATVTPAPRRASDRPAARCQRPARPAAPFVVVPLRPAGRRRPGGRHDRPTHQTYVRRRLVVALALATAVLGLTGAGWQVASRGGVPASAPTARQHAAAITYVVRPGETLWSIALRHHGSTPTMAYVDRLVRLNHGVGIDAGQVITLP